MGRRGLELEAPVPGHEEVALVEAHPEHVVLDLGGVRHPFDIAWLPGEEETVAVDSPLGSRALRLAPRYVDPAAVAPAGALVAPMPGTIVHVAVEEGAVVEAGQVLLTLEAMKMEHAVTAPVSGPVASVAVAVGHQVDQDATLAIVDDGGTSATDDESEAR